MGGGEEEGPNALTLQVGNPPKKICLHAYCCSKKDILFCV